MHNSLRLFGKVQLGSAAGGRHSPREAGGALDMQVPVTWVSDFKKAHVAAHELLATAQDAQDRASARLPAVQGHQGSSRSQQDPHGCPSGAGPQYTQVTVHSIV